MASRRASKKLVNWIADTQHLLANVTRVWIDGKNNVLADVGSRLSWEHAVIQQLPVPNKPILEVIRLMFTDPKTLERETEERYKQMGSKSWSPPDFLPPVKRVDAQQTADVSSPSRPSAPPADEDEDVEDDGK